MKKRYKAIFFDWDGTAVLSRKAPVDEAVAAMRPLLENGVYLAVISGTTYENIAGGRLHEFFTKKQLQNLYLGLGRGAFDYAFDEQGKPCLLHDRTPDANILTRLHDACYQLHRTLFVQYDWNTDLVFSRPNYAKVDLLSTVQRGENLFLQAGEIGILTDTLQVHGFPGGAAELIALAERIGAEHGLAVKPTTDAKYLEVGLTTKSDNTDGIFRHLQRTSGISATDCAFFGDEFVGVADGLFGSDACMLTPLTEDGDFFDVSSLPGVRPDGVMQTGGGVSGFLSSLEMQAR